MAIKLAVLISGRGSNLKAILDAIDAGKLDAEVVLVISSNESAAGLKFAGEAGIETMAFSADMYEDMLIPDSLIVQMAKKHDVDYIVLAGYMRKIGPFVLDKFPNRVINIHPALLPSFKGANAIERAFDRGVKVTGVTVHFANNEYDEGPIIAQKAVEVKEDFTLEQLEEAIHKVEHELYPQVLQWIATDKVVLDDNRVHVK